MRRRRALVLLLAAGALVALRSRRADARRERVTLVYGDGSALTLEAGSPEADRLLALARPALALR